MLFGKLKGKTEHYFLTEDIDMAVCSPCGL